jgi:hypothetical protein
MSQQAARMERCGTPRIYRVTCRKRGRSAPLAFFGKTYSIIVRDLVVGVFARLLTPGRAVASTPKEDIVMTSLKPLLALATVSALASGGPLAAQQPAPRFFIEGLGGAVVPTFDIADVAKTGAAFGAAVGYTINPHWVLMGEFDYGMHKDKATGNADIKTAHYIAKIGYAPVAPRERGWNVLLNLGAGAVSFDVEGAPKTYTYLAINAGAKLAYNFNRNLALVLSPQGDIAFSKKSELTTNNAWVWPFTAGLRVNF